MALSEFEKDEPFAKYTLRNNELERTYRIALPPETGIILHYTPKGGRKVWNVDSNDDEGTSLSLPSRRDIPYQRATSIKPRQEEPRKRVLSETEKTKGGEMTQGVSEEEKKRPEEVIRSKEQKQGKEVGRRVEGKENGRAAPQLINPFQSIVGKKVPAPQKEVVRGTQIKLFREYEFKEEDKNLKPDLSRNKEATRLWQEFEKKAEISSVEIGGLTGLFGFKGKRVVFKGDPPTLTYFQEGGNYIITYNGNQYRIPTDLGSRLLKRLRRK